MDPSAETPPAVEQGPTPDTPPAAGAAPATQDSPGERAESQPAGGGSGDKEPGVAARIPAPSTFRLWVNMKGTVLVRMWDSGAVEVVRRDATWETWGPPETVFEEKP